MGLFNKNQPMNQREMLATRYAYARRDILILLLFTVVNILLAVTQSNLYFLFSAYIPYALVDTGLFMCGMYPEEIYEEIYDAPYHTIDFSGKEIILYILLVVAAFVLLWYFISWKATKKGSAGWMIFTLVYFGLDTVAMLVIGGISRDMIFDYVFHGWMIYSLITGILAIRKLRNLPEEIVDTAAVMVESLPEE